MIIHKKWMRCTHKKFDESRSTGFKTHFIEKYEGWYLFGLIPLYVRTTSCDFVS